MGRVRLGSVRCGNARQGEKIMFIELTRTPDSSLGEIYHPKIWAGSTTGFSPLYVDVGAYDGITTRDTLKTYPELKAITIEPLHENLVKLVENLKGMEDRVTPLGIGLWGTSGVRTIRIKPEKPSGSTMIPENATNLHTETREVPVQTLDAILKSCGVPSIDFLKVDTEGAEHEVLKGFTPHGTTKFHIEYHYNLGEVLEQLYLKNAKNVSLCLGRGGGGGSITGVF